MFNKTKRVISWILALTILLGLSVWLSACGSDPGPEPSSQTEKEGTDPETQDEKGSETEMQTDTETETRKPVETDRETETSAPLTPLEDMVWGIETHGEVTEKETVKDGTLYLPLNAHGSAYYSQYNPAGTPIDVQPTVTKGMYGKCFGYEEVALRNGWFFRCGSPSGAFHVALTTDSVVTFWIYISDKSSLVQAEFELGSTSSIDKDEKEWGFKDQIKANGWNQITLNFKSGTGQLNLDSVCRWRLFYLSNATSGSVTLAVDDILITHATDLGEDDLLAATQPARLVVSPYDSSNVHVADLVLTEAPYSADKTGASDVTSALKKALKDCAAAGGGTVYLPKGRYKLTSKVTVPPNVCLLGDFRTLEDGSGDGDFGTVLDFATLDVSLLLGTSSGVEGVTIYHSAQKANDLTSANATFFPSGGSYIRQVNLVNSYDALVLETAHGNLTVDGLYGTVLRRGLVIGFAAEINVFENVSFSPRYWHLFDSAVSESAIRSYMASKSLYGIQLWGVEGTMLTHVELDGFRTGLYTSATKRDDGAEVYAQAYDLTVKNAEYGIDADALYVDMGLEVACSSISGSAASVRNSTKQVIKLFECTLDGPQVTSTAGTIKQTSRKEEFRLPATDSVFPFLKAPLKLFNAYTEYQANRTGKVDASAAIQAALDAAKAAGGGYVYIPGGEYRLDKPLHVGANTVLLGANGACSFDSGGTGTTFLVTMGIGGNLDSEAAVTLEGENSAIRSIRFLHTENGIRGTNDYTYDPCAPMVALKAAHTEAVLLNFYATTNGILIDAAQDVRLYRVFGGFYETGIVIRNSSGIRLDGVLANLAGQVSSSYRPYQKYTSADSQTMQELARLNLTLLVLKDSTGVDITNTFSYKPHLFLNMTKSEAACLNIYGSRMGEDSYLVRQTEGSFCALNVYVKFSALIKAQRSGNGTSVTYHINNLKGQGMTVSDNNRDYTLG
ncbi:MAG: hypothetical protein IKS35_06305 [Clostridia bacterium]|nr:hypothetical protein [Clostridia bacterium]